VFGESDRAVRELVLVITRDLPLDITLPGCCDHLVRLVPEFGGNGAMQRPYLFGRKMQFAVAGLMRNPFGRLSAFNPEFLKSLFDLLTACAVCFEILLRVTLSRKHVAGFHAWLRMRRYVRESEKGIAILAPIVGRKKSIDGELLEDEQTRVYGFKLRTYSI
jgi:hypothetical protein